MNCQPSGGSPALTKQQITARSGPHNQACQSAPNTPASFPFFETSSISEKETNTHALAYKVLPHSQVLVSCWSTEAFSCPLTRLPVPLIKSVTADVTDEAPKCNSQVPGLSAD